jgi:UTP--glucose-1-phosphate uridylyltransferase
MSKPVRKAIFPIGGLGTRFLPATKAMPKEMIPVIDKPLIQYAVEEARAAGIEQFIFVTGRGKHAIEDHFDVSYELDSVLAERGKMDSLELTRSWVPEPGQIAYLRQMQPLGLGHAVWCARHLIGDEPFAVILADDLIMADRPCLQQMVDVHNDIGGCVVAVEDIQRSETGRYGILDIENDDGRIASIRGLVEKPLPEEAPSTLRIVGRYILDPLIFEYLSKKQVGSGNEIQITDAMAQMLGQIQFSGLRVEGRTFDCGDKIGFFEANIAFALSRDDLGPAALQIIRTYAKN